MKKMEDINQKQECCTCIKSSTCQTSRCECFTKGLTCRISCNHKCKNGIIIGNEVASSESESEDSNEELSPCLIFEELDDKLEEGRSKLYGFDLDGKKGKYPINYPSQISFQEVCQKKLVKYVVVHYF